MATRTLYISSGSRDFVTYINITGVSGNLSGIINLEKFTNLKTGIFEDQYFNSAIGYGNLTNIENLSFNNNNKPSVLSGIIGNIEQLNNKPNLHTFKIRDNSITGSIPSINTLTKLFVFDVARNKLTGPFPTLPNTATLKSGYFNFNQLTGTIPSFPSNVNMQWLNLNSNLLSGELPSNLSQNSNMIEFYCSNNFFTGQLPNINTWTNLTRFFAHDSKFNGRIPDLTGNINLTRFQAENNFFTGVIPVLTGNTKLQFFQCGSDTPGNIKGTIPDLTKNIDLTNFLCYRHQISGSIPSLTNNQNLVNFNCSINSITGVIPPLNSNINLEIFSCFNNQIQGAIPDLTYNIKLHTFECQNNKLTSLESPIFPTTLKYFNASGNLFNSTVVDDILIKFNDLNTYSGIIVLNGTNAAPGPNGLSARISLIAREWQVIVNDINPIIDFEINLAQQFPPGGYLDPASWPYGNPPDGNKVFGPWVSDVYVYSLSSSPATVDDVLYINGTVIYQNINPQQWISQLIETNANWQGGFGGILFNGQSVLLKTIPAGETLKLNVYNAGGSYGGGGKLRISSIPLL